MELRDKIGISIVIVFLGLWIFGVPLQNDAGAKTGLVTKVSTQGVFFKAEECELMMGNGNAAHIWKFNFPAQYKDVLEKAMDSKTPVKVKFVKYVEGGITMSGDYMATSVLLEKDHVDPDTKEAK